MGMGYGTILTPVLLILGFGTHDVIHAVLLSQGIVCLPAAFFHWRLGNIDLSARNGDLKLIVAVVAAGAAAVGLASLVVTRLPRTVLTAYLGIVVVVMGLVLLRMKRFTFSWKLLSVFGVLSVVNKALTGTGFGPVFTSGQLISVKEPRSSVGASVAIVGPICLFAFLAHTVVERPDDLSLAYVLIAGALPAALLGPLQTSRMKEAPARVVLGVLTLALGVFILTNELTLPHAVGFVSEPFFWAFVSMFALIGSSATLVGKRLGYYTQLNVLMVGLFGLGRAMLVLPICAQPCFDLGGWEYLIGGALFVLGLVFMSALLTIDPWPAPDEPVGLVTTGLYSVVRNPVYLGEILWSLGWAVMWHSIIGIALVPLWWAGLLLHTMLEEEDLERRVGKDYTDYKERVKGRIFPGLPV
jgi:protein-S-isoprenylcysteine O-methyltransferase Ste14